MIFYNAPEVVETLREKTGFKNKMKREQFQERR